MAENTGSDIRFHEDIENGSLSKVELYHKLMHDNKKLIYELKVGMISLIGSIIIIACIIYIVLQIKRNSKQIYAFVRNKRISTDREKLIEAPPESADNLLNTKTHIKIGTNCDKEFYV